TVKKSDLTGSVTSINAKTLTESRLNSFSEAMQGRVAGVRVNSQSGEPGADINIQIRGANSINAGTQLLYVIDGIPMDVNAGEVASSSVGGTTTYNPLSIIAPGDIESMEILKDASATAIYGARGANGVVIITTKSGKFNTKTKITANASYGWSQYTNGYNMLNAQEYVDYRHELAPTDAAYRQEVVVNGVTEYIPLDISSTNYANHNWQNELFRQGAIGKFDLQLQGGKDNTTYSASLGYLDQKGLVKNNDYTSLSARFKLDSKVSNKLNVGLSAIWGKTVNTGLASSGGGNGYWAGIVQSIYTFRPILLVNDSEDQSQKYSLATMIYDATRETDYSRIIGNAYANYKILKNLSLRVSGGGNFSTSNLSEFYGKQTLWGRTENGRATLNNVTTNSYNGTGYLEYGKTYNKIHKLKLMAGSEVNSYKYETFRITSTSFDDESTGVYDISKGSIVGKPTSNVYVQNRLSFFGRVNYDLLDRYLFTGTFRADGSSNFGYGNRFGYFPSVAFAWRINNESFLTDVKEISNAKLRLSYGVTGNDRITPYQSMATLGNAYYASNGTPDYGAAPITSANPDLKWETTTQYNGGLDFGMFNNRISLVFDAYYKKTTGMLLNAFLPSQAGFPKQWQNIGDMENKGLELTINTQNLKTKNFDWVTSFNIYTNKNKILSLGGSEEIPVIIEYGYIRDVGIVREGEPLGTAYGYLWDGIYQISDFTWQNNSDPSIPHASRTYTLKDGIPSIAGIAAKPGEFKYKNLNPDEDNVVDAKDRRIISDSNPKFAGGISNEFTYKNFSLLVFFEGVYGNQIFNEFPSRTEAGQGEVSFNLTQEYWYNRWTPENPSTRYGALTRQSDNLASTYYVEDGSYLRFKTLSLSYNLEKRLLNTLKLSSARVFAMVDNLYVWTKYSGLDPDVRSSEKLLPGYDRLQYPRARTFSLGVDIAF
ncbi:MAG: TonB-dependent receptor, partial [Dysgonamonadaceae bacterium]|nr:TonB-dependent receptor [Dysgonamonadaceae bacterium]